MKIFYDNLTYISCKNRANSQGWNNIIPSDGPCPKNGSCQTLVKVSSPNHGMNVNQDRHIISKIRPKPWSWVDSVVHWVGSPKNNLSPKFLLLSDFLQFIDFTLHNILNCNTFSRLKRYILTCLIRRCFIMFRFAVWSSASWKRHPS